MQRYTIQDNINGVQGLMQSKAKIVNTRKVGDEFKKSQMERLADFPPSVFHFNPKLFLDQLPTELILDYLRLYRNRRV